MDGNFSIIILDSYFFAGKKLAGSIVKEKLAACVNRVPGEHNSLLML